uniref:Uncharacterized protein n=1 Tax=Leersia perrieri TaxID=77586 RepID=A0A0D9VWA5_9ORYZ
MRSPARRPSRRSTQSSASDPCIAVLPRHRFSAPAHSIQARRLRLRIRRRRRFIKTDFLSNDIRRGGIIQSTAVEYISVIKVTTF